jgi:hypothetical protein
VLSREAKCEAKGETKGEARGEARGRSENGQGAIHSAAHRENLRPVGLSSGKAVQGVHGDGDFGIDVGKGRGEVTGRPLKTADIIAKAAF